MRARPQPAPGVPEPVLRSKVRRKLTSPGRGLVLVAVFAAAGWFFTESRAQLAVAVGLVAAVVIDRVVVKRSLRGVALVLEGPEPAWSNEPTEWVIRLHGLRRPLLVHLAHQLGSQTLVVEDDRAGRVQLPPLARGVLHRLTFDLEARGPSGLAWGAVRHHVAALRPVPIGPRAVESAVEWPRPRAVGFGLSEVAPHGEELFRSVRPYVRGDERRKIHWKATAHTGELMVREDEGTGQVQLQVVVDLGPDGGTGDAAAGWAAWVAEEALARGWAVHLVTLDAPAEPTEILYLGSPLSYPPQLAPPRPVPVQVRSQLVSHPAEISAQLASAAWGPRTVPAFAGLTCVVSNQGVTWP